MTRRRANRGRLSDLRRAAWLTAILAVASCSEEPTAGPGADELRDLTSSCTVLPGTRPFATDVGDEDAPVGSGTVDVCALEGAVWWRADLDVDCDGGQGAACLEDESYLPETAATDANDEPLDASTMPYVVVPLPWEPTGPRTSDFFYCDHGLSLGGVVAAVFEDQVAYGVIGDEGPVTGEPAEADGECTGVPFAGGVIGEASYAMARALGIDPDPNSGGVDCDATGCPVTYILFAGDPLPDPGDRDAAREQGIRRARSLLGLD